MSDAAAAVRAGPTPGVSRTWLALTYCALTLMTGATSFGSRPVSVYAAAEKHRLAWQLFVDHGRAQDPALLYDVNIQGYARRPLMPALVWIVSCVPGVSWPKAFALVRLFSIGIAYALARRLFRLWLDEAGALTGVLFIAAAAALTFATNNWEILSDFPELAVFAAGMHALCTGRPLALASAVLIGSFNRQTAGFMVAFAAADAVLGTRRRQSARAAVAALAAWAVAGLAVHWWLYDLTGVNPIEQTMRHNLTGLAALRSHPHPFNNFLYPLYVFGPFWVLPLWRRHVLPACLRGAVLAAPLFMVVVLFRGGFNEPRQLLLLSTVLIPAGLIALFGRSPSSGVDAPPT